MEENNKKREYSTGYNSAFDFPDFDALSHAPQKVEEKIAPIKTEIPVQSVEENTKKQDEISEKNDEKILEKKSKKNIRFIVISAILIFAIIFCNIFTIFSIAKSNTVTEETEISDGYNEFATLVAKYNSTKYPAGILSNLTKLYAANNDVVGWLYIPGTNVNTPVLQGNNNEKYLRNNFYGVNTNYGQAYADYKCSRTELNKNTIIYGHNMPSGTHFYDVNRFEDIEWYKQHPTITYCTLKGTYTYLVYTAFYTTVRAKADNGYVFNYIVPNMSNSKFEGFIEQVNQRALYTTAVDLNSSDKIITLSTCNHTYDSMCGTDVDTRLVVIGRLLRSGESSDVDTSKAEENPDYRKPQIYYTNKGKTNPYANATKWYP